MNEWSKNSHKRFVSPRGSALLLVSIVYFNATWVLISSGAVRITDAFVATCAEEARANNHSYSADLLHITSARHDTKSISIWPDPKIKIGFIAHDSKYMDSRRYGDLAYGISQELPLWSLPKLRRKLLEQSSKTLASVADSRFQLLRMQIRQSLLDAAFLSKIIEIRKSDLEWIDTIIKDQEDKFRVATGSHHEIMLLQNENGLEANRLVHDTNLLVNTHLRLNRLLGKTNNFPWPMVELPRLGGKVSFNSSLIQIALSNNAQLKVLKNELEESRHRIVETTALSKPKIGIQILTKQYSGDRAFREGQFFLTTTIPWGNRRHYAHALERDETVAKERQQRVLDFESVLVEQIHRLVIDINDAGRLASLYRDEIHLRTQEAVAAAQVQWELNRITLKDLLDLRRNLVNDQLKIAESIIAQHRLLAELILICGLEGINDLMKGSDWRLELFQLDK